MLEEAQRNHLKEIRHTEIITQIRSNQLPFNVADIIQLTTQYLHEQGLKILY